MFSNLRSLIFKLDPETAHNLAIKSLRFNFVPNFLEEDKNNPLFETFKHVFVAIFGIVSAYTIIGLYSSFFIGIGYFIIQKYNKPNNYTIKFDKYKNENKNIRIYFNYCPKITIK